MYQLTKHLLEEIRIKRPLILNLTNNVSISLVANGLLSFGASPIMSNAAEELDDLLRISNALVINIGTLNPTFINLCEKACKIANNLDVPITFDPVGVGASQYRTLSALELLNQFNFKIVRGNASEIMALADFSQNTKGVDSQHATQQAVEAGQYLATTYQSVVTISGEVDAVVDSTQVKLYHRGSSLMPLITGSGCLLTSIISTFNTVHNNNFEATAAAIYFYGVCGEIAAKKADGPGTFLPHFIDALSFIPEEAYYDKN